MTLWILHHELLMLPKHCVLGFLVPHNAEKFPLINLHYFVSVTLQLLLTHSGWNFCYIRQTGVDAVLWLSNLFLKVSMVFLGEGPALGANLMFTSLVMKLEPCGAHTTGLHCSSNSITPLINAQMLLADPGPHTAFATHHSLSNSFCFSNGLTSYQSLSYWRTGSTRFLLESDLFVYDCGSNPKSPYCDSKYR